MICAAIMNRERVRERGEQAYKDTYLSNANYVHMFRTLGIVGIVGYNCCVFG